MNITLEYLRDRYSEEQARFDHFENKCEKFLTFVSVLIGGVTAVAGISKGIIFHPSSPVGWIVLCAFLMASISIACAWGHSLLALRIGDCPVLPRSRAAAEYLSVVDIGTQSEYIYNCYVDTLEKVSRAIDVKSKNLELAYQELSIGAWGLTVVAFLTICMEISK
ncbi:hypothetical protein [Pseudomonas sp.]|uniref:hypothetical protein n=1 Tax=Pseudomonas sp. TaxID=306 RepID=UPI002D1B4A77|nr:hypothetical protein [Pseudomonas sp.]HUE92962.1 hypothetical protein [Pseudomonas sp.]